MGKYVRKTNRQSWSEKAMAEAIRRVQGGATIKGTAKLCNVPCMSLKRRVRGTNKFAKNEKKGLGRYRPRLSKSFEASLTQHILAMEKRFFGFTKEEVCRLAYELAVKSNLEHQFNHEKKKAGNTWFKYFLARNPTISLRAPEATSAARAQSFNQVNVGKFFALLRSEMEKTEYRATNVYNMDETGVQTCHKPPRILAEKGKKQVGSITSCERGENVTAVVCCNAAGNFIPPMLIYPRKRMKPKFQDGAPADSLIVGQEKGWMNSDLFLKFLHHFQSHTHSSESNQILLILDGHGSHKTIAAIEYCRKHFITMICLPPHCTHRMQPLEVAVFGPLMTYYSAECRRWLTAHPGRVIRLEQVSYLFCYAYRKAATQENAVKGFEKTGIYPFNEDVYPSWMFLAASVTDRPLPVNEETNNVSDRRDQIELYSAHNNIEEKHVPEDNSRHYKALLSEPIAGPSGETAFHKPQSKCQRYRIEETDSDESSNSWHASGRSSDEVSIVHEPNSDRDSSVERSAGSKSQEIIINPEDIVPLPKMESCGIKKRTGRRAATTVLTSSPFLEELKSKDKKPKRQFKKKIELNEEVKRKPKTTKENNEDDTECMFCGERFSKPKPKEIWRKCASCNGWAQSFVLESTKCAKRTFVTIVSKFNGRV